MDNINTGNLIITMISVIIMFIPIMTIFYNLGRRNQRQDKTEDEIKQAKIDINNIGDKVSRHRDYSNDSISELRAEMKLMSNSITAVSTKVDLIKEKVDKL